MEGTITWYVIYLFIYICIDTISLGNAAYLHAIHPSISHYSYLAFSTWTRLDHSTFEYFSLYKAYLCKSNAVIMTFMLMLHSIYQGSSFSTQVLGKCHDQGRLVDFDLLYTAFCGIGLFDCSCPNGSYCAETDHFWNIILYLWGNHEPLPSSHSRWASKSQRWCQIQGFTWHSFMM